jgi:hypothetical protein
VSAPQHFTAPPGWYPDPDGAPGLVRWWNGVSWSDVAIPAGPGVTVGTMTAAAPAAIPGPPPLPAEPPDPGGEDRPNRTPWVIGLTLLVVAVVVVTGVLVGTSGGTGRTPAAATPSSTVPPPPAPPSFPPGTVRVIDEAAGISYPHLGNGWYEYDLTQKAETTSTAGQYFVTQYDPPSGGIYLAECTSGPLAEGFGWTGPDSLRSTALAVAGSERANYYPSPNEQRVLRDEALSVDGHAAHLYEFHLSWEVPGYEATGERAAVLLVDVGRPVPALLFLSIPNTHAELYGVIDRVIEGVEVL